MKPILLISTGGTFNKQYNSISGRLEIDTNSTPLAEIGKKWNCPFDVVNIIGKDSLELNISDRLLLLATINLSKHKKIIIIHGTDTMDVTADYLADSKLDRSIMLTGAMVPYYIDPVEATANLSSAFAYLQLLEESGIYIAMSGLIGSYETIIKDPKAGRFIEVARDEKHTIF
ncbi:MAG: asparaginase domain-containing protein [Campylobacterota bacterium]|nr:asparaginase domain-containing protein [Campylobacterota bacterium]